MELSVKSFAATTGILCGVYFFFSAIFAMQKIVFFGFSDRIFELYATGYPGFAPTILGAVIGLIYGVITGLILGAIFAWLYNFCLKKCK